MLHNIRKNNFHQNVRNQLGLRAALARLQRAALLRWLWRTLSSAVVLVGLVACKDLPAPPTLTTEPVATPTILEIPVMPSLPEIRRPELPLAGIELHAISQQGGLEQAALAGAYWVRRNPALWAAVEPQEGERRWEQLAGLEVELADAARKLLTVILVVRGTPEWAQAVPGSQCGPILPEKLPAFASFLHDLVARYSQPPYHVRYWELGNEPDIDPSLIAGDSSFGCWGQAGDAYYGGQAYAEMLKLAYPQIKAADPDAQVLVGGLLLDCNPKDPPADRSCEPSNYLEGVLKNGGGAYFDGISFHAYDYYLSPYQYASPNWKSAYDSSGPSLVLKARFLRYVLEAYAVQDKYLLNTELGILCGSSGEEAHCLEEAFQLTKAYYVAVANAAAAAEGLRANVWYSLLGWRGTALVAGDLQPLPAFDAFRFSSRMLAGAAYLRSLDQFAGVRGYEFIRDGQRFWLLWSLDGAEHPLELPVMPAELYDVFGAALDLTQTLNVSPAPLYVVFLPE